MVKRNFTKIDKDDFNIGIYFIKRMSHHTWNTAVCSSIHAMPTVDLGARAEAAKVQPKNV